MKQLNLKHEEIVNLARAYRSERDNVKKAKIIETAVLSGVAMTAFISAVDGLVNPDTTIGLYTNKQEKVTGLIIHGKQFSHRGVYLPFNVVSNFDEVVRLVNDWKKNPTCKY